MEKQDPTWRAPLAANGARFLGAKISFRSAHGGPPRSACQSSVDTLHLTDTSAAQRGDPPPQSRHLSMLPKAARVPALRAAGEASNPPPAARSHLPGWWRRLRVSPASRGEGRAPSAATPRERLEARGLGKEAPGSRAERPARPASAPSFPHWLGRREGGGGAALTSLRAVPASEGGAGSSSEPSEAANQPRTAGSPRATAPRPPPAALGVRPPGQGRLGERPPPGPSPGDTPDQGPRSRGPRRRPTPAAASRGPRPPCWSVSAAPAASLIWGERVGRARCGPGWGSARARVWTGRGAGASPLGSCGLQGRLGQSHRHRATGRGEGCARTARGGGVQRPGPDPSAPTNHQGRGRGSRGQWEAPRGEGSGFAKRGGERGQMEVGLQTGFAQAQRREYFQSEALRGESPRAAPLPHLCPYIPSAFSCPLPHK